MDKEEEQAFEDITPDTKRIEVTVPCTYSYEVSWDFRITDKDALTALLSNGTPVEERISGDSQDVRDLATNQQVTFIYEG